MIGTGIDQEGKFARWRLEVGGWRLRLRLEVSGLVYNSNTD